MGDHEGSENVGVAEVKTNQDIGADEPQVRDSGTSVTSWVVVEDIRSHIHTKSERAYSKAVEQTARS